MDEASFPAAPFKLPSFGASEAELTESFPSGRSSNGHVCQTPNLNHPITEGQVVVLSTPERYSEDWLAAPVLAEKQSLPMMIAEIALWGGGVTCSFPLLLPPS
jgi:hypothetical protein